MVIRAATLVVASLGMSSVWAQESTPVPSVLHIQHTVTTSKKDFPQFAFIHHVLDGVDSSAQVRALTGTISLQNNTANFSEVLWLLAYWQGSCPAKVDANLTGANFLWSDILKNPSKSTSTFPVDLYFPNPLPMTGCVALILGGGKLAEGVQDEVTMSADLSLVYEPSAPNANTIVDFGGEYCFGRSGGCENATLNNQDGFAVPIRLLSAGHLVELFGNISDSTFDGTADLGPLPKGKEWGARNDFYLLHGSCGKFAGNLNSQGFPNPLPLTTLHSWLPHDAVHLASVPLDTRITCDESGAATLQQQVQKIFAVPLKVDSGDCVVVIYGRKGDGATDDETQVKAVLAP